MFVDEWLLVVGVVTTQFDVWLLSLLHDVFQKEGVVHRRAQLR
jgi:hypothetical protein